MEGRIGGGVDENGRMARAGLHIIGICAFFLSRIGLCLIAEIGVVHVCPKCMVTREFVFMVLKEINVCEVFYISL